MDILSQLYGARDPGNLVPVCYAARRITGRSRPAERVALHPYPIEKHPPPTGQGRKKEPSSRDSSQPRPETSLEKSCIYIRAFGTELSASVTHSPQFQKFILLLFPKVVYYWLSCGEQFQDSPSVSRHKTEHTQPNKWRPKMSRVL